jgi:hypothetical protein
MYWLKLLFKDYNQDITIRYLHIYTTVANWQRRSVWHGIKQTVKSLWYPLFQAQWDRCDKKSPNLQLLSDKTSAS